MAHEKLNLISKAAVQWCELNGVQYYMIHHDESDIAAIMLYRRDRRFAHELLAALAESIKQSGICVDARNTRGGTVLLFSLGAIAESAAAEMLRALGEEYRQPSFTDRVVEAMFHTVPPVEELVTEPATPNLLDVAQDIVKEMQYKWSSSARVPKQVHAYARSEFRPRHPGTERKYEQRIEEALEEDTISELLQGNKMGQAKPKSMQGIASPTGHQPSKITTALAKALRVYGRQTGTNVYQDLKRRGIYPSVSKDQQTIVFGYARDGSKPVLRISYDTLVNPGDFAKAITTIAADLAHGQAPGTFDQLKKELSDRSGKAVAIANASVGEDPNSEQQQLQQALR